MNIVIHKSYYFFLFSVQFSSVAQPCLTLCNPLNCSMNSVHGISQARILEWVAISFSRGSSWPRDRTQVSHIAGRQRQMQADALTSESPGKSHHFVIEVIKCKSLFYLQNFVRLLAVYIKHKVFLSALVQYAMDTGGGSTDSRRLNIDNLTLLYLVNLESVSMWLD